MQGTDSYFPATHAVIHQFLVIADTPLNDGLTSLQRFLVGVVDLPCLNLYIHSHFCQVPGLLLLKLQVLRLLFALDQ
ncbi:hypothetical protein D3C85_1861270 [compost metagenome]